MSLSPSSSESQATDTGQFATHSLSKVVFPKPAGAEIKVNFRVKPASNFSSKRGREMKFGREDGI
jgi:hypothetical protein